MWCAKDREELRKQAINIFIQHYKWGWKYEIIDLWFNLYCIKILWTNCLRILFDYNSIIFQDDVWDSSQTNIWYNSFIDTRTDKISEKIDSIFNSLI